MFDRINWYIKEVEINGKNKIAILCINVLEAIKIRVERLFASKKFIFLSGKQDKVVCNIIGDTGGGITKTDISILNAKKTKQSV